jgi:hypothetical protein
MTLDELKARAKADLDNAFEKGKSQGGGGNDTFTSYASNLSNIFYGVAFPEGYEAVIKVSTAPTSMNSCFWSATGVKKVTLICDKNGTTDYSQLLRGSTVEILDITNFKPIPTKLFYLAFGNVVITSILGELDLSSCTDVNRAFSSARSLKDVRFKKGTIGISMDFSSCVNLSAESYDSIIKGHSKEASVTLTLPALSVVQATYNAVYGEGAWNTITAEYPNVTIVYS